MNKADEMRLLEEMADRLDPLTTYCGGWLREQIPAIRLAINGDLSLDMVAVSYAAAGRVVEEARIEAAKILAEAQEAAEARKAAVNAALAEQLDRAAFALNSAAKRLWEAMP